MFDIPERPTKLPIVRQGSLVGFNYTIEKSSANSNEATTGEPEPKERHPGIVKFFIEDQYGFITDSNGVDVFFNKQDMEKSGLTELKKGQKVSFCMKMRGNGKINAERIKVEG